MMQTFFAFRCKQRADARKQQWRRDGFVDILPNIYDLVNSILVINQPAHLIPLQDSTQHTENKGSSSPSLPASHISSRLFGFEQVALSVQRQPLQPRLPADDSLI
ncbi:hypothetical protein QR680_018788 [Steinernema hermaphroditum]|uniref:Uncharacterized protein n=1 Tax=Steinernema hermaphroditum TaxID=289476 RepID=A0AA39LRL9_9BILA|nr:hypothetical protein QR680_018788 [Steinernema hermaphroditum]